MTDTNYCIREFEINDDKTLNLYQIIEGQVNAVVWDASLVLAGYLILKSEKEEQFLKNKIVIELGAGVGLCGMVAATLEASHVDVTDVKESISLLQYNVKENADLFKIKNIFVKELCWSKENAEQLLESTTYDYILMSDCVYYKESIDSLIDTLKVLLQSKTKIILAQELRESKIQIELFKEFLKKTREFICFTEIPKLDQHPDYQCDEIMLFIGVKK